MFRSVTDVVVATEALRPVDSGGNPVERLNLAGRSPVFDPLLREDLKIGTQKGGKVARRIALYRQTRAPLRTVLGKGTDQYQSARAQSLFQGFQVLGPLTWLSEKVQNGTIVPHIEFARRLPVEDIRREPTDCRRAELRRASPVRIHVRRSLDLSGAVPLAYRPASNRPAVEHPRCPDPCAQRLRSATRCCR